MRASGDADRRAGWRLIVGMGATGLSVARYFVRSGTSFAVTDTRATPPAAAELAELADVPCAFGALACPLPLAEIDEAVISPGVALDHPFVDELRAAGVALIGDIELFARTLDGMSTEARPPVLAVTGSNGKSTVVAWTRDVLCHAGIHAVACGNFSPPALDALADDVEAYVLEVSSFQLEMAPVLNARMATVLNLSTDHIDRHGSLARYAATKARVFAGAETALINADDPWVKAIAPSETATRTFGSGPNVDYRLVERDGRAMLAHPASSRTIPVGRVRIPGRHNWFNALAVWALAAAAGASDAAIATGMPVFSGLSHRAEIVAEANGVAWIDDSKSTNLGAATASLENLTPPIVWLVGGQAKGADFTSIGSLARRVARVAVVYGADGPTIADAISGYVSVVACETLAEAVAIAAERAESGDTVLLSPGCASFDQFAGYAERGEAFAAAVKEVAA
ncbi:UDP-N-acetylmuramoyl-L-alanine--D-glutamate ligase [Salinisphaera sp. USBA-960]|nr:UDP-N-acetylmuramoyl-L-alanine--D-glutamate ligase [Salifodinibacter halophilus]NNC26760.1 UDP-N-acetylmuramoyl-L-alanine--D-glutamate ligase [Salifodinibacter halophilus]